MRRARTRQQLLACDGMKRQPGGNWTSRNQATARAFQRDNGGILLVEGDQYEICYGGCTAEHCHCRGDRAYIDSLAPSWDESHPDNTHRQRHPRQPALF